MDRRRFLTVLAVGAAGLLTQGCAGSPIAPPVLPPASAAGGDRALSGQASAGRLPPRVRRGAVDDGHFPPPVPGPAEILEHAPAPTRRIALTIDDGYDAETVSAYVQFAQDTGIAITFSPNGLYRAVWEPHARVLAALIDAGQVQIGNHTYDHRDLTQLSDAGFREQVERNEAWIEKAFKTTSRPYLRPPYGARDARTDELSAGLGYTRTLLWNATFGDSRLLTPQVLLAQARKYLRPGAVVLGHANHPTVTHLYPQLLELIRQRDLQPVTLDTMFGTTRATGA